MIIFSNVNEDLFRAFPLLSFTDNANIEKRKKEEKCLMSAHQELFFFFSNVLEEHALLQSL